MEAEKEEIIETIKQSKTKTSSSKDELINNIKEWIKIDNELTKLKAETREKTTKKKQLTESLVRVMKSNSIDCFDINGGALIYKQRKTKKPISCKFLLNQLQEYFKDDIELANQLTKRLLDNREQKITEEIKRKIEK